MSSPQIVTTVARELSLSPQQVANTLTLFGEGNTLPFIARYRKEVTGGLDEVQLRDVRDRAQYLTELDERRTAILKSIEEQGKLDDALRTAIDKAETKQALEDLYLPYKPKRRTRATIARERGLEPLAELLWGRTTTDAALEAEAAKLRRRREGRPRRRGRARRRARHPGRAHRGRRRAPRSHPRPDARRRRASPRAPSRARRRRSRSSRTTTTSPRSSSRSRRIACSPSAAARPKGSCSPRSRRRPRTHRPDDWSTSSSAVTPRPCRCASSSRTRTAACSRPRVEIDLRLELKTRADEEAIAIFGQNLEQLLLASPAGERVVIGLDPGYRTGVKVAVVSRTGAVVATDTVYLHQSDRFADHAPRAGRAVHAGAHRDRQRDGVARDGDARARDAARARPNELRRWSS